MPSSEGVGCSPDWAVPVLGLKCRGSWLEVLLGADPDGVQWHGCTPLFGLGQDASLRQRGHASEHEGEGREGGFHLLQETVPCTSAGDEAGRGGLTFFFILGSLSVFNNLAVAEHAQCLCAPTSPAAGEGVRGAFRPCARSGAAGCIVQV